MRMLIDSFCLFVRSVCAFGGLMAFTDFFYFALTGENIDWHVGFFIGALTGGALSSLLLNLWQWNKENA